MRMLIAGKTSHLKKSDIKTILFWYDEYRWPHEILIMI